MQKQKIIAFSSCEAKYIVAATAACQGVWLNRLLGGLKCTIPCKVKLLVDNKSAINLCKNLVHYDRSKHIDTRFHFIRECVKDGKVLVAHVSTNEQLADIRMKALGHTKFIEIRQKLGVIEVKLRHHD